MKTIFSFSLSFAIGLLLSLAFQINPVIGGLSFMAFQTAVGFANYVTGNVQKGSLFALQQETWVSDIAENLFNGSEFVRHAIDDSALIVNALVHLPQAGAIPVVEKNRSTFPAAITERTDADKTYPVDNYTIDPIRVRNFEELQTSYAKRQSVIGEQTAKMGEELGDQTAYTWAPSADASRVFRTSGAAGTANGPTGSTGNRLMVTRADIAKLAKRLDNDKMQKEGRFLMLPPEFLYDLLGVDALVRMDFMSKKGLPDGVIDKLFGFNIMTRSQVVTFDNASDPVKKAVGAAAAATDNFGAIAWSKYAVRSADGAKRIYLEEGRADHYGDIMSGEVNFGSATKWTDNKGIVSLVQASV